MEECRENDIIKDNFDISNEEYKRRIIDIFNKMDDNKKLRFWFRYISTIEEG